MLRALAILLVWTLAAASATAWALRTMQAPQPVPVDAAVPPSAAPGTLAADWSRIFGTAPIVAAPPAAAAPEPLAGMEARYRLVGLAASPTGAGSGVALISLDGKPARAFAIGQVTEPGVRIAGIGMREVTLARAGHAPMTLRLAPPAAANRGVPGAFAAGPGARPGMPPMIGPGGPLPGAPGMPGMVPDMRPVPGMVPTGDAAVPLPEMPPQGMVPPPSGAVR